ncbi:hypothetical protein ES703_53685 [subsurface metagenome]
MTVREIVNQLLTIKQRHYPDLTQDERTTLDNAVTILIPLAEAFEAVQK